MHFNPATTALFLSLLIAMVVVQDPAAAQGNPLPIADAHVHYSHDSVEMTPPARVIELMRAANLKLALVSSSDDKGTQLLSDLAPDLIIPGLRPYRRRGELNSWFTDPQALAYVEQLLASNRYASLGEFHLYGDDAQLEIPRRIVELADQHNLVLHAHSDAEAVEHLLAQNPNVKVLWAHSGFDGPAQIAGMLARHDRLWADLAFRSEVGRGGLDADWIKLFTDFPDRMMLGTDTYTPERMFFIPEHANNARQWLSELPAPLAERIAWKNAYELLMPIWKQNNAMPSTQASDCPLPGEQPLLRFGDDRYRVTLASPASMPVSQAFAVQLSVCADDLSDTRVTLDASMPQHGHGMNYTPQARVTSQTDSQLTMQYDGLILHMPGRWQWRVDIQRGATRTTLTQDFSIH